MKMKAWVLDVNQEVVSGVQEILLWAINENGERVLLIDRSFLPHFYVVVKEGLSLEDLKLSVAEQLKPIGLVYVQVCERRRLGKPLRALKVVLKNADVAGEAAELLQRSPMVEEVLEDDIRPTQQYFLTSSISPSSWLEAEVEDLPISREGVSVPSFLLKSPPRKVADESLPRLRSLALYVIVPTMVGSPSPERDRLGVVAAVSNEGREWVFANEENDDRPILLDLAKLVLEYDPDVVISWGGNRWLWNFLVERCKKLGVAFGVGRQRVEPHQSLFGHFSIIGRVNVDLMDVVADDPEVKVKTLENAARHYGVWDGEVIDQAFHGEVWEADGGRDRLSAYALRCARALMRVWGLFNNYLSHLSRMVKYPMDYVVAASPGFRVEGYLMCKASAFGELIPKRVEAAELETYKGGIVLEPKIGIHENVAVLDFAAMYPHLIIKYNISPDTYVPDGGVPDELCNIAPEVGHRFLKEPEGLYKLSLVELLEARDGIRKLMKGLPREDPSYAAYEAQQRAIKVIANAVYGYAGWAGARWYLKPVAEAVAAWGRATIKAALKMAEEANLDVVYGDTDSLFLKYDRDKIQLFQRRVLSELGLEIKVDKLYTRVLFTEAKKRYVGLMENGQLDVVGLEAARGDWCEAAKRLQEEVSNILLSSGDVREAVEHVRQAIRKLKVGAIPFKDLIIWKTLSKPLEEYKVSAPHVTAALRLKRSGWDVKPKDQVGFVIVKGHGKLHERAYPYMLAQAHAIDSEYYVENQLIPAALRILEVVGVKKEQLRAGEGGLLAFF